MPRLTSAPSDITSSLARGIGSFLGICLLLMRVPCIELVSSMNTLCIMSVPFSITAERVGIFQLTFRSESKLRRAWSRDTTSLSTQQLSVAATRCFRGFFEDRPIGMDSLYSCRWSIRIKGKMPVVKAVRVTFAVSELAGACRIYAGSNRNNEGIFACAIS